MQAAHFKRITNDFKRELAHIKREEHQDDIEFVRSNHLYWNAVVQSVSGWYLITKKKELNRKTIQRLCAAFKSRLLYEGYETKRILKHRKLKNPEARYKRDLFLTELKDRLKYIKQCY